MEKEVYLGLIKAFDLKQAVALITITGVRGSTPRKPGAKMLVFPVVDVVRLRLDERP